MIFTVLLAGCGIPKSMPDRDQQEPDQVSGDVPVQAPGGFQAQDQLRDISFDDIILFVVLISPDSTVLCQTRPLQP